MSLAAASRTAPADLSRRAMLRSMAAAGGGLMLSVGLPFPIRLAEAVVAFAPNAFVRIDRDGKVVLTMPYVEMGQGTYTYV
jgi:isoquinoline 1-oxidoreductase subunit beta